MRTRKRRCFRGTCHSFNMALSLSPASSSLFARNSQGDYRVSLEAIETLPSFAVSLLIKRIMLWFDSLTCWLILWWLMDLLLWILFHSQRTSSFLPLSSSLVLPWSLLSHGLIDPTSTSLCWLVMLADADSCISFESQSLSHWIIL